MARRESGWEETQAQRRGEEDDGEEVEPFRVRKTMRQGDVFRRLPEGRGPADDDDDD